MTDTNVFCFGASGTHLFAGTFEGRVLKRPLSEIITGISEKKNETPKGFVLNQNYPNPFNPTTNIKFSITKKSFTTLKVFDALGKEVSNLISKNLPAAEYLLQWNAEGSPCGIYFYRLETESFSDTKKLILIK